MQLKLVNRLASVKEDGTVQFDVPGDIKPQSLDFGTGVVYHEAAGEECADMAPVKEIPPLQIVMLIVGTRGDVQPFVAIAKRLQVPPAHFRNNYSQLLCGHMHLFSQCVYHLPITAMRTRKGDPEDQFNGLIL
ncbi:unnamed protein product [Linum tenue]|uniref:Uncharacterized protein n=1 Tax=Linum tenue TaxID=586396 RepID=A0AAV0RPT7_9ROSI|nr:unnamed protein product [Linum tenue]